MKNNYKELIVWQKSVELAKEAYRITRLLPREECYVLSEQMRRAAVSIPSNIAEGQSRNTKKDFINFLSIAKALMQSWKHSVFFAWSLDLCSRQKSAKHFSCLMKSEGCLQPSKKHCRPPTKYYKLSTINHKL